jgi:hypothetical protein
LNIGGSISGALFTDENRTHRLALWRIWDRNLPALLFTGLNPSTAAEYKDDPTVYRVCDFAKRLGFGGAYFSNLHPFVSPYPASLYKDEARQYFAENDTAIQQMVGLTSTRLVGWGEWGKEFPLRVDAVLKVLGQSVYCLKINPSGEPTHPLYLPRDSKLIEYKREVSK